MFTSRLLDNKDSPSSGPQDKNSQRSGSAKLQSLQKQLLDSGVDKDPHLSNIRDKLNASGIRSGRQKLSSNVTARTPSGTSMILNSTLPSPISRTRSHDTSMQAPSEDKKPTGPPSVAKPVEMVPLPVPRLIQGPYGMPLIQTEVPATEMNDFPPKHMANPFRNSTSLRDVYPPIAPRKDQPARSKIVEAEALPTITNNYELGVLAQEPSKFFFDDSPKASPKVQKPVGNPNFFGVDKLPRNIPRQQQLLFDVAKRTQHFPMGPKKPLYIMNLAVDSGSQKKLYIFEDTDPWQKAYQFVEANNLEDEMVPLVADLIENDKRKYLQGGYMGTPARQNYKEAETPSTAQGTARPNYIQSGNKPPRDQQPEVVTRGARQAAFDQVVLDRPPLSPIGTGTKFEGFHLGQRANILDSMVDSQTEWNPPPIQQRPPVPQKMARTNSQPNLASVQAPPLQASTVGYSPDSFYLKESGPVQTVAPHILNFVQKMQSGTPGPQLPAEDESMLRQIFSTIDVEQRGAIKSFEVSLSTLSRELRTIIGPILRTLDEQSPDNTSAGFESITYDLFVRTVVQSGKLSQIKLIYSRH